MCQMTFVAEYVKKTSAVDKRDGLGFGPLVEGQWYDIKRWLVLGPFKHGRRVQRRNCGFTASEMTREDGTLESGHWCVEWFPGPDNVTTAGRGESVEHGNQWKAKLPEEGQRRKHLWIHELRRHCLCGNVHLQ